MKLFFDNNSHFNIANESRQEIARSGKRLFFKINTEAEISLKIELRFKK